MAVSPCVFANLEATCLTPIAVLVLNHFLYTVLDVKLQTTGTTNSQLGLIVFRLIIIDTGNTADSNVTKIPVHDL